MLPRHDSCTCLVHEATHGSLRLAGDHLNHPISGEPMANESNKQERETAQASGSKPEGSAKPDQAKGDSQKPKGVDENLLKTVHTEVKDEAVEDPQDKEFIKNAK